MANEATGLVFAPAAGGSFPPEFRRGLGNRFDRRFTLIFLICMAVSFTTIGILSLKKPPETISAKEITKIQERYAQLVLNQPKPIIEPKVAPVSELLPEKNTPVQEEKKEEVKVDREKETFVEREKRKESGVEKRRQVREQAVKQIQSAGIFAAITAAGGGSGQSSQTSDLLGTAGVGVTNIGNISVSKGTFVAQNVDAADLATKRGSRTTDVTIEKERVGRATAAQVASSAEVTVSAQTPEVTGEAASASERSQSAIQGVVSRESKRLKRLYEESLKRDPMLSGRITVKFVILPSGEVSNITIVKSTTNNDEFDTLVVRYIKRWKFPPIEGNGPVEVVYPFVFEGQS